MAKTQKKKYVVYKQKFLKDPAAPEWATPRVFVQKLDKDDVIAEYDTMAKAMTKKKEIEEGPVIPGQERKCIILEK